VELLSPAGDRDSFFAAVNNGADAVYLGITQFNARQNAKNFSINELQEVIDYAHVRGKSVYLTINTLLNNSEIAEALKLLELPYKWGIDGVIIQDIGFAAAVKKAFPSLPMHGSTQMSIYNIEGVKKLEEFGFKRIVLARELNLEEIEHISANTNLETEVFVHGALCISYSGQCLMSSVIGGRSGNRGKCAQPCRLPYRFVSSMEQDANGNAGKILPQEYYLSPKDLCSVDYLEKLIKAGVSSLKIEGRMKSSAYVATVVRIYRKYLDLSLEGKNYKVDPQDMEDLLQIFNRGGFSCGYHEGKAGRAMMCFEKPKNWGIHIGDVISYNKNNKRAVIKLYKDLCIGDGVEIWNNSNESPSTVVTWINAGGKNVKEAYRGQTVEIGKVSGKIDKGMKVYRISSKKLIQAAESTINEKYFKKIQIRAGITIKRGLNIHLSIWDNEGNSVELQGGMPEEALNKELTSEKVKEQLQKTGPFPFEFSNIEADIDRGLSVPASELNGLRRDALKEFEKIRAERYRRKIADNGENNIYNLEYYLGNSRNISEKSTGETESFHEKKKACISIFFYNIEKGYSFKNIDADRIYLPFKEFITEEGRPLVDAAKEEGFEVYIWIPAITRGNYDNLIKSKLKMISRWGFDGIMTGNVGTLDYALDTGLKVHGDYSLNIFNSQSLAEMHKLGLTGVTISPELNMYQIKEMPSIPGFEKEALVYGRITLMTSEYCPAGSIEGGFTLGKTCRGICSKGIYKLKDRMGMEFPVLCDNIDCRSIILNSNVLFLADDIEKISNLGLDIFRINISDEKPGKAAQIAALCREAIKTGVKQNEKYKYIEKYNDIIEQIKKSGYTKGHYFRGV